MTASNRASWSHRWAFIFVAVGSAVGLGNIWKFPYMVGANGGSAFVLIYLICVALIGIPLLLAEALVGRRGHGNPVTAMARLSEESGRSAHFWTFFGWTSTLTALVILSFYSVVSGWILDYLWQAITGVQVTTADEAKAAFGSLLASPVRLIGWHTLFLAGSVYVVARGVVGGIEKANQWMLGALFCILLMITAWGAVAGDMGAAIDFMFDFKLDAVTPTVVLAALGHAFFSLSLGIGAIMAYGSYLGRDISIGNNSLWITAASIFVGLFAGLAIFSLTFQYGLEPSAGPGLILQTLPLAFSHMPGGRLFSMLFFLLVLFAALTSALSLLEPFTAWLTERVGIRRVTAVIGTGVGVWLLGVLVSLSFNVYANLTLFGMSFFDALDYATSRIMMPMNGMAIGLFVAWGMKRVFVREEMSDLSAAIFALWFNILRYVVPVGIVIVFLNELGVFAKLGL
jgi:NSS family neurotransmitter:Na+ symporter